MTDILSAEHGYAGAYIFTEEGVYQIELVPLNQRLVMELWPAVLFVGGGLALVSSNPVFYIFLLVGCVIALKASGYLSNALGRSRRRLLYSRLSSGTYQPESEYLTPWSKITSVVLSHKDIRMTLDGRRGVGRIQPSDFGRLKELIAPKIENRFIVKN
jgi:hypothetical protein